MGIDPASNPRTYKSQSEPGYTKSEDDRRGDELFFFTRSDSIWRSLWVDGAWSEPEMISGSLAGEPTIDSQGNVYFVRHFFLDGQRIEADIYMAGRVVGG